MNNKLSLLSPLGLIHPRSMKYLSETLASLVKGRLWLKVIVGMVLGLVVGIVMGPSMGLVSPAIARPLANWLALPGQLFLALIQMIVIPLVFASVIRGLAASESVEQLRQMGLWVALFFMATTALATAIGLSLALLIRPGTALDASLLQATIGAAPAVETAAATTPPALDELPRLLVNLLPGNPLSSMVESQMLQVVVFAIIVGVALVSMAPVRSKPMLELLGSLQEVCMTVVRWAMWLAPFAVFGLLAQLTMKVGVDALIGMAVYVMTVLLGLLIMFGLYLILLQVLGGVSPRGFLRAARDVLLLAFSTSSSAAVMPLSIRVAEDGLGVRPSVAQFVIPLGATINMNGTALYQGVAAVFLAQAFGIDLGTGDLVLIVIMAVGASIGSPATPGVGIVILAMVLSSVGVPPAGIALLMGVDRILDMSRTAINVNGDLLAAKLIDKWIRGGKTADEEQAEEAERERRRAATREDTLVEKQ